MNFAVAQNASLHLSYMDQQYDTILSNLLIILNGILGFPLNGCVVWLILKGPNSNLASEFFHLNLALSEILYSLLSFCFIVFTRLQLIFILHVFTFAFGFILTARPLFQSSICVECYVGAVHPVFYLHYKPMRYKAAICCVYWLITLGSCMYCIYSFSNVLYLYGFFIQNVILLFVTLFCCLATIRALKQPGPGEKVPQRKKSEATKRKALKIMLLIAIIMTINFFSYVAAIPLQCCISTLDFSRAFVLSVGLAIISGFMQPLLFFHRRGKLFCFRGLSI